MSLFQDDRLLLFSKSPVVARAGWAPYDRVVALAARRGIAIDFHVTVPGPLWAMPGHPPGTHYAANYRASPRALAAVREGRRPALQRRLPAAPFPGARPTPLPRVNFWTIWNEPNPPDWLAPQWRRVAGRRVQDASRL